MKRKLQQAVRRRQHGVVLVLTLIVLVALTLASLALVRSVDTSGLIAGNLAFKQSAAVSADAALEAAIGWIDRAGGLDGDQPESGYYASNQDRLDLTGNRTPDDSSDNLDWDDATRVRQLGKDAAGNSLSYVMHRMCDAPGALNGKDCAVEESPMNGNSEGSNRQMLTYQGIWDSTSNRGLYRITVRVTGPRSNVSYAQAVISH